MADGRIENELSSRDVPDVERSTLGEGGGSSSAQENTTSSESDSSSRGGGGGGGQGTGLQKVREFMAKIKPADVDRSSGPSWQELQLEPTPTLLPKMRYASICRLRAIAVRLVSKITALFVLVTMLPSR